MKVSTKGRYGLRAMAVLAANSDRSHVSLVDIASSEGISENYLEQIFSVLRKAGLVRSVKGAQGGYSLAAPAGKMTAGEILRTLEGSLSVTGADGGDKSAGGIARCIQSMVWDEIDRQINLVADTITLQDIADEYMRTSTFEALTYEI